MKPRAKIFSAVLFSAVLLASCGEKNYYTPFLAELLKLDPETTVISSEQLDGVTSLAIHGNCTEVNPNKISYAFGRNGYFWGGEEKSWDEHFDGGFDDIAGFEKLTELSICYNPQLDSIKFLSKMTELKSLTIEMGCFTDLSPIKNCKKLEYLKLVGIKERSDISALSELTNLKRLTISGCSVKDIQPLSGLTELSNLEITFNYSDVENLEVIGGLTKISYLSLICPNIDISFLKDSEHRLESLTIGGGKLDLSTLSGRTDIYSMRIENAEITDLSPLETFNENATITISNSIIPEGVENIDRKISVSESLPSYMFFWELE